jgi:DNA recombination protein Rad52
MGFTEQQRDWLNAPLDSKNVKQRKQGGGMVDYVDNHHAVSEANRIFDFDGWNRETVSMDLIQCEQEQGDRKRWKVGYIAKVRITVGSVVRDGTGFGNGLNDDLGAAHELAVKEAETDAMKRALMTFGNTFGLALYDKTRAHVAKPERGNAKAERSQASQEAQRPAEPTQQQHAGGTVPDGKSAFGYQPARWPLPKMFDDICTESQRKMAYSKAHERMLAEEDISTIRRLILEEYGLGGDAAVEASKAGWSLFIDWLINADEDHLDRAVSAAESAPSPQPLELT